jgi:iron complex outermembrane receptor protein
MAAASGNATNWLWGSASTIVLASYLVAPTAAAAQDSPAAQAEEQSKPTSAQTDPAQGTNTDAQAQEATSEGDTIIVTGVRRALQSARARKKNADTVMDSISATDIGAFPDKSVADALQRVPGVTVNRFAATGDTAHFSAEPSGVVIRGLPQVRNELNGRDVFSANSGRGLSWSDVPAELLAGVDTYKNQTADLIEGGIAGSVNLRTRVPFDATGQLIQVGAKANYGDLSKKWTPDLNAFYSNRWQTGIGEVGLMGHVAYSRVRTRSQGIQEYRVGIFENGAIPGSAGVTSDDWAPGTVLIPNQVVWRDNEYDRKRTGIAAAGQWRSNDQKWLATAQFLRSTYKTEWQERVFGANLFGFFGVQFPVNFRFQPGADGIPIPALGADDFTFNDSGFIDSGDFNVRGGWWGNADDAGMSRNEAGEPMIRSCYSWSGQPASECPSGFDRHGDTVGTASRLNQNRNMTQDAGLNLKWEATDNLRFNFDGQYVTSKIDNYDIEVDLNSFADVGLTGLENRPRVTALNPPANVVQSPGGLTNLNNWYINAVMDHLEESEGHEASLRADGEWDIPNGWLDTVKFGARYADRDQTVRWSTYNWHNVANTWTNGCQYLYFNLDAEPGTCDNITFHGYPSGAFEIAPFGEPFHGGTIGDLAFVPFDFLSQHRADEFSFERTGVGDFVPICERAGQTTTSGGTAQVELPDSCFTSGEIADISEETHAGYAMVKFGDRDELKLGGIRVRGNIGLRYIGTIDKSNGALRYPVIAGLNPAQCPGTPLVPGGLTGAAPDEANLPPRPPGTAPYPAFCYLTGEDLAFASGGDVAQTAKKSHSHFLPSFNVRFDLGPSWLLRLAASRAMSRPDIGLLKNFQSLSIALPTTSNTDPLWIKDPGTGRIVGVRPFYTGDAFNPYLKPITAWQFDASLEHYFGTAGLFSFAVFQKSFYNYIQYGTFNLDVTRDGVTRTVQMRGPANGKGAKIRGFEVAYNRFFDFLPKPFDGLGMQANYTFVKGTGIPNTNLSIVGTTPGTTNEGTGNTALDPGALEGLSKHTFNLVGLFEKGPIAARVAYNWRSRFLVTAYDCCVRLPVWQKSAGFLDASLRYSVNKNIEVSLEGSNILNTKTVLQQQLTDESSPEGRRLYAPNAWFQNDRRFTAGVRWKLGS